MAVDAAGIGDEGRANYPGKFCRPALGEIRSRGAEKQLPDVRQNAADIIEQEDCLNSS